MASRNAEKQRRYRQRLSARGLVHVQGWVTPAQAEAIRRILAERGEEALAGEPLRRERETTGSSWNPARAPDCKCLVTGRASAGFSPDGGE